MEKFFEGKLKIIPYLLVILFFSVLYLFRLDKIPVHLNQDELMFSLNGYTIAKTGHDYYGNSLPFYFWHLNSFWATPVIVYLTAIFLKFLPLSEISIRIPSIFVALLSSFLIMVLAEKIFEKRSLAIFCGVLFLSTPVLFINSRLLLDNVYPIPFILLWLLFLKKFDDTENPIYILFSGLALGVGIHSYHAAKIMMPIYFVASIIFLFKKLWSKKINFVVFVIGFLIPIILFIPWIKKHPDTLFNQVSYISSIDTTIDAAKGYLGVFNLKRLGSFVSNYFTYLGPKILFVSGDRSLIHSTGKAGAFLFPVSFLIAFGVLYSVFDKEKRFSKLILFGFLTYPIAPAIVNDPERISRGLIVIPFAILLSMYGVNFIFKSKERLLKPLLYGILIISFLQFGLFLSDYFTSYRSRSYSWFNYDIGGAFESAIRSTKIREVKAVYLDSDIPFIDLYSQFYQVKFRTNFLSQRFYDFNTEDFSKFPAKSLVMIRSNHISERLDRYGFFEKIESIREPDGNESFYIFYRD